MRTSDDQKEQLLFVANMEGQPVSTSLSALTHTLNVDLNGWRILVSTPGRSDSVEHDLLLTDGEAITFVRTV
jgi:hypothetical protein